MKVHTRKQVMYKLDISSSDASFNSKHDVIDYLAKEVSKVVGGCTVLDVTGYWADVERADRDSYEDAATGTEYGVQFQVKAEVDKEDRVEYAIVQSLCDITLLYDNLEIDWVCGEKVQSDGTTVAFNFSIKENVGRVGDYAFETV